MIVFLEKSNANVYLYLPVSIADLERPSPGMEHVFVRRHPFYSPQGHQYMAARRRSCECVSSNHVVYNGNVKCSLRPGLQ